MRLILLCEDARLSNALHAGLKLRGGALEIGAFVGISETLQHLTGSQAEFVVIALDDAQQAASICTQLRLSGCNSLVILIVSEDDVRLQVRALIAGADDVISMANLGALTLRLNAHIERRRRGLQRSSGTMAISPGRPETMNTDFEAGLATLDLTPIEERLVLCLHSAHGGVVTREELCRAVWRKQTVLRHTLYVHISLLRRKLAGVNWSIASLRDADSGRRGYSLLLATAQESVHHHGSDSVRSPRVG